MPEAELSNDFPLPDFLTERWDEVTPGFVLLVFTQAEKRLNESTKTADSITNRAYALLGICVTILTLILSYLVTHTMSNEPDRIFILAAVMVLAVLVFVFWKLFQCILPYQIDVAGSEPKFLLNEGFIDGFQEEEQVKTLYLSECKSYQERINNNHRINRTRMDLFTASLKAISFSPLSFFLSWALLRVCSLL